MCQRILKHDKLITENSVCQKKFDIRNRNSRLNYSDVLFSIGSRRKREKRERLRWCRSSFFFNVAFFTFSTRCHVLLYFQNDIYLLVSFYYSSLRLNNSFYSSEDVNISTLSFFSSLQFPFETYCRDLKKEANKKTIGSFLLIFLSLS